MMGLFFFKAMFQMANTSAWWQPSVFKKYFLTNSGKRKTKGKGASVVIETEEKKAEIVFFFPSYWMQLPEQQQSVTVETPAEMHQNHPEHLLMIAPLQCFQAPIR